MPDLSLLHSHSLRPPRRSRRVHHVRQTLPSHLSLQLSFPLFFPQLSFYTLYPPYTLYTLYTHHLTPPTRQLLSPLFPRDHHPHSRILQHPPLPLHRPFPLHHHIRPSRLPDPQHRSHQLRSSLQLQSHSHFFPYSHPSQISPPPFHPLP